MDKIERVKPKMSSPGRLSILMVSPSYYPHIGGVEYVVKSVAERLARKGHDVHVLCGEQGIDKPVEDVVDGGSEHSLASKT